MFLVSSCNSVQNKVKTGIIICRLRLHIEMAIYLCLIVMKEKCAAHNVADSATCLERAHRPAVRSVVGSRSPAVSFSDLSASSLQLRSH